MSYQPKHLGHVNIYVRNVERSHKWYSDLLGLHTYAFFPGWAAFMSADLSEHASEENDAHDHSDAMTNNLCFARPRGDKGSTPGRLFARQLLSSSNLKWTSKDSLNSSTHSG